MKVFISWSGPLSNSLAKALSTWLPDVITELDPFFSPSDISKGDIWPESISRSLQESQLGIFCITRENYNNPWLLFEAGAISNSVKGHRNRVIPIFFDGLKPTDVTGPLSLFQGATFEKEDMLQVMLSIHSSLPPHEQVEPADRVRKLFSAFWNNLDIEVTQLLEDNALGQSHAQLPLRSKDEMLHETLEIVRNIQQHVTGDTLLSEKLINKTNETTQEIATLLRSEQRTASYPSFIENTGSFLDRTGSLHGFTRLARNICLEMLPPSSTYSSPRFAQGESCRPNTSLEKNKEHITSLLENLAELFRLVAPPDARVWTSLRDRRADDHYHTFVRAGMYDPEREKSSMPIPKDSNMLLRLRDSYRNQCCVLLTGSQYGPQVWNVSENDKFGEDKSVMVGAILTTSWDNQNQVNTNNKLAWLITVNADTKDAFRKVHIDLMQTCVIIFSMVANIAARESHE